MLFPSALPLRLVMAALSLVPRQDSSTANYLRRFATFGSHADTDWGGVRKTVPLKLDFKHAYASPHPVCHAADKPGVITADNNATCTLEDYTSYNTNTTHNYLIADYLIYRQSHKMIDKLDILSPVSDSFASAFGIPPTKPPEDSRITRCMLPMALSTPGIISLPRYVLGDDVWNNVNWATSTYGQLSKLPISLTEACSANEIKGSNWPSHSDGFNAFIFSLLIMFLLLVPVLGKCLGLSVFVIWSITNGSVLISYGSKKISIRLGFAIYDTDSILSPGYVIGPDTGSSNASDTLDIPLNTCVLGEPSTPVFFEEPSTAVVLDDPSPTIVLCDSQKDSSKPASPSLLMSPSETDKEPYSAVVSHGSLTSSMCSFASGSSLSLSLRSNTAPTPSKASPITVNGAFSVCDQCTAQAGIYLGLTTSCAPGLLSFTPDDSGLLSSGEASVLTTDADDKPSAALAPSSHVTTALKGRPFIPIFKKGRLEPGCRTSNIFKVSLLSGSAGDAGSSDGDDNRVTMEDDINRAASSVVDSLTNDAPAALPSENPVSASLPYKKKTRRGCRNRGRGGRGKKVPPVSVEAPSLSAELPVAPPADPSS